MACAMAKESRNGSTAVAMKDSGVTVRPMAEASSTMLMVTSMRATGSMTRQMVTVLTPTPTAPNMLVHGAMINSMGSVLKLGLMVLSMKVNTSRARKMEEVSSHLPMAPFTRESSR